MRMAAISAPYRRPNWRPAHSTRKSSTFPGPQRSTSHAMSRQKDSPISIDLMSPTLNIHIRSAPWSWTRRSSCHTLANCVVSSHR